MSSLPSRLRWTAAVVVAFVGGLLLASGLNLTRMGFAQSGPATQDVRSLAATGNAFVSISDRVTPAVVSIFTTTKVPAPRGGQFPPGMLPPGFQQFFGVPQGGPSRPSYQGATGSGFIVTKDGYILTNNHVVTGPDRKTLANNITVKLLDGREYKARVIGHDPSTDVAVIKIDGNNFPTVPLGNDNNARVGEWVLAIGNPLDLGTTVTAGIVSAKDRPLPGLAGNNKYAIGDFIQTDAAINPGNSGGPLVDVNGQAIGINSAIASETGYYSGYGFAIPITLAKKVMDDIIAHGKVQFGVLGVAVLDADADAAAVAGLKQVKGAVVQGFSPDTPDNAARRAGLQPGDVIIAMDGKPVDRVSALQRMTRNFAPGNTVTLTVMRYGKQLTFNVTLMPMPGDSAQTASASSSGSSTGAGKLGIQLAPLPPADQRPEGFPSHGVLVASVDPLGPSAANGQLGRGDVITGIRFPVRRQINSIADLQSVLSGLKSGSYVSLDVVRLIGPNTTQSGVANIQLGGQ